MRDLLSFIPFFLAWTTHASAIEPRQNAGLSTCVQSCHDAILPIYDCASNTNLCFCVSTGLQDMLDVCVASNCTIAQQLESRASNARTCDTSQSNQSVAIKILSWTLFGFATAFFSGRLASRTMSKDRFRVDDWMVFSCYAALVGSTICIHLATANGLGAESYLFSIDQLNEFVKLFYASTLMEHFILFGTKVVLVMLYLRILPSSAVSRAYRSLCWAFIGLLSLTFVATELATVLQCTPIDSIWNSVYGKTGQCLNSGTLHRASSAFDLIYGVALLFLPVPPLLAAKLSRAQNLGLTCIYITGLAVIICTLGRTIISPTTPTTASLPATLTSSLIQPTIWTILQTNLSIILICLPPLSNLLTYIPLRIKKSSILPHNNNSAEEILAEEDRRSSGLTHQQQQQMQITTLEIPNKSFGVHRAARHEENINNESPGLHVGVGDSTVTFQHSIPKETTRDKFVYKDAEGRMHEVELIDRPALVVEVEGIREDGTVGDEKSGDGGLVVDEKCSDEELV